MWKVALIAGAVVVAVGATFAVGLFVGHWFGVGEEPWRQVTLPVAEAEQRVGPVDEFLAVVEAQAELDTARQALAGAEATLATAPPIEAVDPWGMREPWQGGWCLDRHRAHLRLQADWRWVEVPVSDDYEVWVHWAETHRVDFFSLCTDVVVVWGRRVAPSEKAPYEAYAQAQMPPSPDQVAVSDAQAQVVAAEGRLSEGQQSHQAAVEAAVGAMVDEAVAENGPRSEDRIRSALADAEWVYCDTRDGELLTAGLSLGLLPENPGSDLVTFWWVTRPDEYIQACRAAYELR